MVKRSWPPGRRRGPLVTWRSCLTAGASSPQMLTGSCASTTSRRESSPRPSGRESTEHAFDVSPDGRLIAYLADSSELDADGDPIPGRGRIGHGDRRATISDRRASRPRWRDLERRQPVSGRPQQRSPAEGSRSSDWMGAWWVSCQRAMVMGRGRPVFTQDGERLIAIENRPGHCRRARRRGASPSGIGETGL